MCFLNHLTKGDLTMTSQSGFNRRLRRTPAAAAALLFILALLAGCSGTGTMYTPETTPSEGISGGTAAAETAEGSGIPADTGDSRHGHGSRRQAGAWRRTARRTPQRQPPETAGKRN